MKKYNKEIISKVDVCLNGDYCEVYCLDDGDYYSIHVVNECYWDTAPNTLKLQEPKEITTATSEMFLTCIGIEFLLWHQFYGKDGKMHSFQCQCCESCEL